MDGATTMDPPAAESQNGEPDLGPDAGGEIPGVEQSASQEELLIEGDGQLTMAVGGKRPTSTTVKLIGGKIDIPAGQLDKGQTVVLRVEAVVGTVAFVDETDAKTGQVVGCARQHVARVTGVSRLDG